jgi:Zn-finger nucleic acid-binding protein
VLDTDEEEYMSNRIANMQCPVFSVPLTMSERQNVEIDYCPQCRGVSLDRCALNKIIERAAPEQAPAPQRHEMAARPICRPMANLITSGANPSLRSCSIDLQPPSSSRRKPGSHCLLKKRDSSVRWNDEYGLPQLSTSAAIR